MRHLIAVYGTLKRGFHNDYLLEECNALGTEEVSGFKMYSMGGYPAINLTADESTIEVEVYEVDNPAVLRQLYQLEGYTGERDNPNNWYDTTDVKTTWGKAEIFYFKQRLENYRPLVEGGVWRLSKGAW